MCRIQKKKSGSGRACFILLACQHTRCTFDRMYPLVGSILSTLALVPVSPNPRWRVITRPLKPHRPSCSSHSSTRSTTVMANSRSSRFLRLCLSPAKEYRRNASTLALRNLSLALCLQPLQVYNLYIPFIENASIGFSS